MPIYQYTCRSCGATIEKMQSVSAAPLVDCPECQQPTLKKILTPAGIIFKGSGWYITDSKHSSSTSASSSSSAGDKASAATASETKPTESATTPTKSET